MALQRIALPGILRLGSDQINGNTACRVRIEPRFHQFNPTASWMAAHPPD